MVAIESFPHHNEHYENDDRQAGLIVLLLNGFLVFVSAIAALIILASAD